MAKTDTKLTERERIVLAAWFARSNAGLQRASREEVEQLLNAKWNVTLQGATVELCQEFMESDEHEKMFCDEAKMWHGDFVGKYKTREAVLKVWPDVAGFFGWETRGAE